MLIRRSALARPPQFFGHGVEFGKVSAAAERVVPVEREAAQRIEQAAAQRKLALVRRSPRW